eukprot:gene101-143_t
MNSIRRVFLRRGLLQSSVSAIRGGHHHGPAMPPFARLAPPTGTIPEEVELVWDDAVAPETCIDFDAPTISGTQALLSLFTVMAGFATLFGLICLSDPVGNNPVAPRSTVLPFNGLRKELTGMDDEDVN